MQKTTKTAHRGGYVVDAEVFDKAGQFMLEA